MFYKIMGVPLPLRLSYVMITVYYNYYNPQQNGKQIISNWGLIRHSEVLSILHGERCSVIPLKHNEPQVLGQP